MDKKKIYCFIGLPGSGKGTQAVMFAKERKYARIGIGNLVRDTMKNGSKNNKLILSIKSYYSKGHPVPDGIIFKLLEKALKKNNKNIVFDNFPFNREQAKFLQDYTQKNNWDDPKIIYIKLDPESVVNRIAKRRICPKCGIVFHKGKNCQKCGIKLVKRTDDNKKTARERIKQYSPNINDVLDIYSKKGSVIEINGEPSIPEVKKQVEKIQ